MRRDGIDHIRASLPPFLHNTSKAKHSVYGFCLEALASLPSGVQACFETYKAKLLAPTQGGSLLHVSRK